MEEDGVVDDITAVVVRFGHGDAPRDAGGDGIALAAVATELLGSAPGTGHPLQEAAASLQP